MDISKLTLIGRLTSNPQQEGRSVQLSVLTRYRWQDYKSKETKDVEEIMLIYAVGKLADICKEYLKENSRFYCEAHRESGRFVADEIIMLGKAPEKFLSRRPLSEVSP